MPRSASGALSLVFASGGQQLSRADAFTIMLSDGVTQYDWTSWRSDLVIGGTTFTSKQPWIERSKWNVTNTMAVPSMTITLMALNDSFAGGAQIKTQTHNGLFDGASIVVTTYFMPTPGDVTTLGGVTIFTGVIANIELNGSTATITAKGKNNLLDQFAPRNVYQIGCVHAFCDAGCTLNRASFTASYSVGASPPPTNSFIPWASAPATPAVYVSGTMTVTSGGAAGQKRTIAAASASGLTLAYPLYETPAPGDTFTAFQGCDKTFNGAGSVQSCTSYSNTQNYRGFPYVPPPNMAY